MAGKFGAVLELVAYPNSNTYIETFGKGEWDIGFLSKTPLTADKADFISDVLLNEYWFIAAPGREFSNAAQVDRPGVKIGVGRNSSSDQFLSRTLKSAQLVRDVTSIEALRSGQVDVWAASASNIQEVSKRLSGAKIVPGSFTNEPTMVILPKGRSSAARAKVVEIVDQSEEGWRGAKGPRTNRREGCSCCALIDLADTLANHWVETDGAAHPKCLPQRKETYGTE